MGAAEKQLESIAGTSERWDIPALRELRTAASSLAGVMTEMIGTQWEGKAPDAANVAFAELRKNFELLSEAAGSMIGALEAANAAKEEAAQAIGGLKSAEIDPAIVVAARTASAIVFRGITLPADGAISFIEGILGNDREEEAQAALDSLENKLVTHRSEMMKAAQAISEYSPVLTPPAPLPPLPPTDTYTPPSSPGYPSAPYPSAPPAYVPPTAPGGGTGVGLFPDQIRIDPPVVHPVRDINGLPVYEPLPDTIDRPSVDGSVIGTLPGTYPSGQIVGLPGGSSDFGGGGSGSGSGSGGLGGGHGSGGLGAGLIGGGVGSAAAAAAAAAKARLNGGSASGGASGAGSLGGAKGAGLGAGGLGGPNGIGGANGASGANGAGGRLGAGGLGGANGIGAGGNAGAGGAGGAGGTGAAGGTSAAGATRAGGGGGGGLLGSQGGGAAGGNGATVTSTTTQAAGGRGTGMMGGGAGSEEKDKRVGLGGLMAPKLNDESDAAPRSAGASAGGRVEQPQD